jgi:SSS family solute:Na+ symporter
MNVIDLIIFVVYFLGMLGVGFYFFRKNESSDDYYVGGRQMSSGHIGLSVVATDVGGGFSIGLGGLGFMIGLSGSWMLFTGLVGAWLAAVFLIPKVSKLGKVGNWQTFPQLFGHFYNGRVALLAGIISAIGYIGFTSSQLLAGAKLASATFLELDRTTALWIMGFIAVVYTVFGGLKAVIYTDTIQWIILMTGLVFIGIPLGYYHIGGLEAIRENLAPEFLQLTNIGWIDLFNWGITIIPIWFVGMTLYQRIYACKDEQTAKRAWFIAGLFEYPIMAFMGVLLGMFAHVGAQQGLFAYAGYEGATGMDPEMGLPLLIRTVLPAGLTGLMLSAYFSAIMSTADSCLMAASGNVVTDILQQVTPRLGRKFSELRLSQVSTFIIGGLALLLASFMENVLSLMLLSYAFMVSGLLVPVIGALYWKKAHADGALAAMITGGSVTIFLTISQATLPLGLDPNVFGIATSAIIYILICNSRSAGPEPQLIPSP